MHILLQKDILPSGYVIFLLFVLVLFFSFRVLFLTFIVPTNAAQKGIEKSHDAPTLTALRVHLL